MAKDSPRPPETWTNEPAEIWVVRPWTNKRLPGAQGPSHILATRIANVLPLPATLMDWWCLPKLLFEKDYETIAGPNEKEL